MNPEKWDSDLRCRQTGASANWGIGELDIIPNRIDSSLKRLSNL